MTNPTESLTEDDLLDVALRLLGEYTDRTGRPALPDVLALDMTGRPDAVADYRARGVSLHGEEWTGACDALAEYLTAQGDLLPEPCPECERTDDCERAPGINPLI